MVYTAFEIQVKIFIFSSLKGVCYKEKYQNQETLSYYNSIAIVWWYYKNNSKLEGL